MSDPSRNPDPPRTGRNFFLTLFMVLFGAVLVLPGLCALGFSFSIFSEARTDPELVVLWFVCILIAAGGIALIVRGVRG